MLKPRPKLFRGRHFRDDVILLCVRWYLRYSLSYRDLEELMAERGLSLDHSTVARWVLRSVRPRIEPRSAGTPPSGGLMAGG
jgi:transposase, IS6 family